MPTAEYYRIQAQICAQLALISGDPSLIARCNTMALEHLARAAELDAAAGEGMSMPVLDGDNGSDMHRD